MLKFGEYLVERQIIKDEDVQRALELQVKSKIRVGEICLELDLMTSSQVMETLSIQMVSRKHFGSIAIENHFLSRDQLDQILKIQRERTPFIGQILVTLGALKAEQMISELQGYANYCDSERVLKPLPIHKSKRVTRKHKTETMTVGAVPTAHLPQIRDELERSLCEIEYQLANFEEIKNLSDATVKVAFLANRCRGIALVSEITWIPVVMDKLEQCALALGTAASHGKHPAGAAETSGLILRAVDSVRAFLAEIENENVDVDAEIVYLFDKTLSDQRWAKREGLSQEDVDQALCLKADPDDKDESLSALKGKEVLIIDDAKVVRTMLKKFLESHGAVVKQAETGAAALKYLMRSEDFKLLIVDLHMPVMDGIEFVSLSKRIKRLQKIPVLILTSSMNMHDAKRAMQAGIQGYVLKKTWRKVLLPRINHIFRNEK